MPKTISKRYKESREKLSGWDNAIADAEKSIKRLQLAIKTFLEMKAAGEPWPGDASTHI